MVTLVIGHGCAKIDNKERVDSTEAAEAVISQL